MFKNTKLSLKIILVAIMALVAAFVFVGAFAFFNKQTKPNSVPGGDNNIGEGVAGFISFTVDYESDKEDLSNGGSVSASGEMTTYDSEDYRISLINWTNSDKLKKNDKLFFYIHNDDATSFSILIQDSSGNYRGTISGVINTGSGKKFSSFDVGYKPTGSHFEGVTKGIGSGGSVTIGNNYDPNYTGKIFVQINMTEVNYRFYGYYDLNDGEGFQHSEYTKTTYNKDGVVGEMKAVPSGLVEQMGSEYAFACWYLDVTTLVEGEYIESGSTYNGVPYHEIYYGDYFVNNDVDLTVARYTPKRESDGKYYITVHRYDRFGAKIKFEVDERSWKNGEGNTCYNIISVKGETSFTQGTENPIIKARFTRIYNVTIEDGGSKWEGYPDGLGVTEDELHGVLTQDPGKNTTQINAVFYYGFYYTDNYYDEDRSFYHKSDMGDSYSESANGQNKYAIYNYGHTISSYIIKVLTPVTEGEYKTEYIKYDMYGGQEWLLVEDDNTNDEYVPVFSVPVAYRDILDLSELAYFLDGKNLPAGVKIILTPVWEACSIWIDEVQGKVVTVFDEYGKDENGEIDYLVNCSEEAGKTAIGYYYGESNSVGFGTNYIMFSGIWNYANIHHGDLECEEKEEGYSRYFSYKFKDDYFKVLYADNIYQVNLQDVSENSEINYRQSSDYVWTNDVSEINIYEYYSVILATNNVWDFQNFKPMAEKRFIDEFVITYFAPYVNEYVAGISTDEDTAFEIFKSEIFKYVYKNNAGDKFIYIANNQKLTNLPVFTTDYAQTIMWKSMSGDNVLKAWITPGNLGVDANKYTMAEDNIWTYSESNIELYAHNAYRIKMYQDASVSNDFTSEWSEWFGLSTKADFSKNELTDDSTGAEANGWIFDTEQAEKEGYSVTYSGSNSTLTITKGDNEWVFSVQSNDSYNKNLYFVEKVRGQGEFIQERDTEGSIELPIVRLNLKWPDKTHTFNMDNSNNYWANKTFIDGIELPDSSINANLNFGGVYLKSENKYANEIAINNVGSHTLWPLTSSDQKSQGWEFKYSSDFKSFDYAVYNYGHYITSWTVNVKFSAPGRDVDLYYGGGRLVDDSSTTAYPIGTLGSIASTINSYYEYLVRSYAVDWVVNVALKPNWSPVSLTIKFENGSTKGVTFGDYYELSIYHPKSQGQTFLSFALDDKLSCLVSSEGVWDYVSGGDNYERESTGNYEVTLKNMFVDNIYQVSLNNIYLDDLYDKDLNCATLSLQEASTYSFKDDELVNMSVITCKTLIDDNYEFVYFDYEELLNENYVMDAYIVKLKQNKDNWERGILEQSFSMFNNVYVTGADVSDGNNKVLHVDVGTNNTDYKLPSSVSLWMYIANNKEITTLPFFGGEYTQTLAWKDSNNDYYLPNQLPEGNAQITKIYEDQLEDKAKSSWDYSSNSTVLNAVNAYRARYYYEGNKTLSAPNEYEYMVGDWYLNLTTEWNQNSPSTQLTALNTNSVQDKLNPSKNEFGGWLFNAGNIFANDISCSQSGNDFIIDHGDGRTLIRTSGLLMSGSKLYKILSITGNELFAQNSCAPIIMAKLNGQYSTTIDNSRENVYWVGRVNSPSETVAGVMYTDGSSPTVGGKVNFNVADTIHYAYPFMSSIVNEKSTAFYLQEDFQNIDNENLPHSNNGAYAVYNYGHYITAWQVIVSSNKAGSTEKYYLKYDGSGFVEGAKAISTGISTLVEKRVLFSHIAAVVDNFNAGKIGINYTITLIPQWQAVEVAVVEKDESENILHTLDTFNFAEDYDLDTSKTDVPDGKSLIAYEYTSGGLIATNDELSKIDGFWNYSSIPCTYYDAESLTTYGNTTYTITVTPVLVSNIYRVGLKDVYLETLQDTDHAILTLDTSKTSYKFNSNTIANGVFTYENNIDEYSFQTFEGFYAEQANPNSFLMDNYVAVLFAKIEAWNTGLLSFGLFNQVYYTIAHKCTVHTSNDEVLNLKTQNNTNWYVSGAVSDYEMWIYLAHEQNSSSMPVFKNDYAANIAWYDDKVKNYFETDKIDSEERLSNIQETMKAQEGNTWDNTWNYTGDNTQLTATYAYRARYYYESKNTKTANDEYDYVIGDWYYLKGHIADDAELYTNKGGNKEYAQEPEIDDLKPNKNIFYGWIIDLEEAESRYGKTNVVRNTDKVIITHANGKITIITVDGKVLANNDNLWFIRDISGGEILDQDPKNPIIKAKLGLIYNSEINNENVYWNEKLDDYTVAGVVTSYTKQGESSALEFYDKTYIANLEIANKQDFSYPFMNSILGEYSSVFYHNDDFVDDKGEPVDDVPKSNQGYYYVYNYGHYLSGWKIFLPNANKYLIINTTDPDNWKWEAVDATTDYTGRKFIIPIEQLANENFANFKVVAALADSVYADTFGDDLRIVFYPQWEEASIQVKHDETELLNSVLKFGSQYKFKDNSAAVETGKSLMAYAYNGEKIDDSLIAAVTKEDDGVMGRWNYAEIKHDYYGYVAEDAKASFGDVVYTMIVFPVLVDNVYAVELENARVNLNGEYEIGDGYIFNNSNGLYDGQLGAKCLTFKNNFSTADNEYSFKVYNNELLVDSYIENLKEYRAMYLAGINGDYQDDFTLFKKVFYTSSNCKLDEENYNLLDNKDNTNKFYLYLANGQVCDYLPVFKNAYNNLIFWENSKFYRGNELYGKYAYITRDFLTDDEDHKEEISKFLTHSEFDGTYNKLWFFTDGDGTLNEAEALVAHYFRKNYYLDVITTYKQEIDRRGYVLFDIYDTLHAADSTIKDEGGKYLVICENEQMEVYKLNLEKVSIFVLNNLDSPGYATRLTKVSGETIYIELYAGCDVTMYVRDQSKDVTSMSTGYYDEMIGYKFKTFTQTVSPETEKTSLLDLNSLEDKTSGYKFTTLATTWVQYDYKNKSILGIDVEFENIFYDLVIKMQDEDTGKVLYALDGEQTGQQSSHVLTDLECGNEVMSRYLSYAGFTLDKDAFVLYYSQGNGHTLQEFDDATQANGDVTGQIHTFVIDGTWLRENLYSRYINNYAIYPNGTGLATQMGDLTLQTEAIVFTYGFITRDYVNYYNPTDRVIDFNNRYVLGNISLARDTDGKYSALTPTFNEYIVESERFTERTYWFVLNGVYYSLWQSELYYYDDTSHADQYITQYSFPIMTNAPSEQHKINMAQIAAMVEVYKEGLIIANNIRNINLLLDVSPYIEQSIYVQADLCADAAGLTAQEALQDPNRGTRIVQINYSHNGKNETIQMSINANANIDTNNRFVINYNSNAQAYTVLENNMLYYPAYVGMNLSVEAGAQYANDYLSVDAYSIQSVNPSTRNIMLAKCDASTSDKQNNGFEYIRFNAKPLHANYIYKFVENDGTTRIMNLNEISEFIVETESLKTSSAKDLYIDKSCNALTYEVKVKSSKYVVEVKVSGLTKGKATIISLVEATAHIINVSDYDKAIGDLINIEVIISSNETSRISFIPAIIETQNHLGLENFGSYDIVTTSNIDGEDEKFEYKNLIGEQVLQLVDGEEVEITFNLAPGYRYVGYKYGNTLMNTDALVDSKIIIISNFNVEYHAINGINQYILVVEKIPVNATIDTSNSRAIYTVNDYNNNAIVYVGQTITFSQINTLQTERLICFYYYNQGQKVFLTNDGTINGVPIMSVVLTSEMIECCNVTGAGEYVLMFYSEIMEKFQATLTVTGVEYLVNSVVEFKVNGETLSLYKMVNGRTVTYSAYFDRATELNILASVIAEGKYDVTFNNNDPKDLLNEMVVINNTTNLTVAITPKQFEVLVTEKLYENLEQLDNEEPVTVTEENMVNALVAQNVVFNETASIMFIADKYQDRRLTQIVISGNDNDDETIIDLTNADFKTSGTMIVDGYTLRFEQLANKDVRVVIGCITQANISLELTYTQYKAINS